MIPATLPRAEKPRRTIRIATCVVMSMVMVGVGTIFGVCVWSNLRRVQWTRLGGGVELDDTFVFGPRGVYMLRNTGDGPSTPTEQEMKLLSSVDGMLSLPFCNRLYISQIPYSREDLDGVLRNRRLRSFHGSDLPFDDESLEALSTNPKIERIALSNCPVTIRGLRRFLSRTNRSAVVQDVILSNADIESLSREFGDRIVARRSLVREDE